MTANNEFCALLEPLMPMLRRYARSLTRDADRTHDLVQDTLVQAISKQDRWEPGTNIEAWLITIMRNKWRDDLKRIRRHGEVGLDMAPELPAAARADVTAILAGLRAILAKLPPDYRRIVVLAAWGHSQQEIADTERVPRGTVASRTNRGRQMLRQLWE